MQFKFHVNDEQQIQCGMKEKEKGDGIKEEYTGSFLSHLQYFIF